MIFNYHYLITLGSSIPSRLSLTRYLKSLPWNVMEMQVLQNPDADLLFPKKDEVKITLPGMKFKPADRLLKTASQGILRGVSECLLRPGNIGKRIPDISRPGRFKNHRYGNAGEFHDRRCKLVQVDPQAACDIVNAVLITLHCLQVCPDNIPDIDKIPGLPAVAVDNNRVMTETTGDNFRDHAGIGGRRILARAEDVEIAQCGAPHAVQP